MNCKHCHEYIRTDYRSPSGYMHLGEDRDYIYCPSGKTAATAYGVGHV